MEPKSIWSSGLLKSKLISELDEFAPQESIGVQAIWMCFNKGNLRAFLENSLILKPVSATSRCSTDEGMYFIHFSVIAAL